jgi:NAD(P)-dependent dehydrogenase (short-subunit alcohol dehydrogenase family)
MLAIVTGASRGIGLQLVKEFSKNSQNLVVAVTRDPSTIDRLVEKNATNVLPLKADISNPKDLKKLISVIRKLELPVDILVNNAGTLLKKKFEDITLSELQAVYHTNVFVPFILIQSLAPFMNSKNGSHIVNIGSMGGFQGSSKFKGLSAYSSSKAALSGLTECLAEELKEKNICVNCLALGSVQTEMLAKAFPGYNAPLTASQMAEFICHFAINGHRFINGKVIPVSSSTP